MTQVLANTPKGFETSRYPVTRLYSVASSLVRKIGPGDLDDREVLHYSIPNVQEYGTGMVEDGGEIESDKWVLEDECVLISKLNPRKATVCLAVPSSSLLTVASTEFIPLATGSKTDNRFLNYLLQTPIVTDHLTARTESATRSHQRVNPRLVTSLVGPWPDSRTRQQVVEYLDRETAEIDAFIEDHERLLQLLDERVTTTIEATILGVDAATTVDTGQEWPATLPFGWTAQRVSWLFDATGSGTTPTSDDVDAFDGDIPWVTTGELREKAISTSEKKVSSETLRRYSALKVHPTGSLLIAMYGATIGRVGWLEVPATVNQAVCVLSGYKAGPLRFPYYALLAARPYLLTLASGGGQPNINQDKIRSLRLPVPLPAEQERIVAELDHTLEAEYAMRRDVERSLELARERKTALISAAVTGQIDVAAQDVSAAEQLRDELEAHL